MKSLKSKALLMSTWNQEQIMSYYIRNTISEEECFEPIFELINTMEKNNDNYQLDSMDELMEYMWLSPERTLLNVDIFVDDGGSYLRHNHSLLLFARNGYDRNVAEFIPFKVSECPAILNDKLQLKISEDDILRIRNFIARNSKIMEDLANRKISQTEFVRSIMNL